MLNKIRRMPTEYEKEAIRFNRRIERVQTVCHVVGALGAIVGFLWTVGAVGSVDMQTVPLSEAFMDIFRGVALLASSAVLANM